MHRLIPAGCVLALILPTPVLALRLAAQEKTADNPATLKLNRDIPRHKEFLQRIEKTKGEGDVIFLIEDGVLPGDLSEAIRAFEKDKFIQAALGPHISNHIIEAKRSEWQEYIGQVHPWELERYLAYY